MTQTPSTERYIENTQADGRLLIRFISRRSDRSLGDGDAVTEADRSNHAALFEPAEQVAGDPARIVSLLACVDELSLRAAPANVRSIRLTAAYLGISMDGGEPPTGIRRESWWIWGYMGLVGVLAVLLLLTGVGLLAHMDGGRRLMQQLKDLRQQEADVRKDIATLALEESVALGVLERRESAGGGDALQLIAVRVTPALVGSIATQFGKTVAEVEAWQKAAPLCERPLHLRSGARDGYDVSFQPSVADGDLAKFALTWWREPVTQKAAAICRRFDDVRVRMALIYSGMADWNCRSHQMYEVLTLPYGWAQAVAGVRQVSVDPDAACGAPTIALPPEVGLAAWRSHETTVAIVSSVVAGFLLPLLLGCLGGCAYAMRRVDQKLSTWTLEPQDGRHAIVRVALAAVLGGLVGVVWTSGEAVAVGGFSLSLAAAAFFIGFSVEPVFKLIETVVIEGLLKQVSGAGEKAPPKAG